MNPGLITLLGGMLGGVLVAVINWISNRGRSKEEVRSIYVTASDMVVDNLAKEVQRLVDANSAERATAVILSDEVKRLSREIALLHSEVLALREMVVNLGGDPSQVRISP